MVEENTYKSLVIMQLKPIDIKMGKKNYQVLEYMCNNNNNNK